MKHLLALVMLFIFWAKAAGQTEKIKQLMREISDEIADDVLEELRALAAAGKKYTREEARTTFTRLAMTMSQKQKQKILELANLLKDPNDPGKAIDVSVTVKRHDVLVAYDAIIEKEGSLSKRRLNIQGDLDMAGKDIKAFINKLVN